MFIPTYVILFLKRFFVVITKYTVLDEQWREAKERKSQRRNPRSITRGASTYTRHDIPHRHTLQTLCRPVIVLSVNVKHLSDRF